MPTIEDHSISFPDFFNSRAKGVQLWVDVDGNRRDQVRYCTDFVPTTWLVLDDELKSRLLGPHDGIYAGSVDYNYYSDKHDSSTFTLRVKKGVWRWGKEQIVSICADFEKESGRKVKISVE